LSNIITNLYNFHSKVVPVFILYQSPPTSPLLVIYQEGLGGELKKGGKGIAEGGL